MNISTIEQYVEQKNRWNAIFKGRSLSLLVKRIECGLHTVLKLT